MDFVGWFGNGKTKDMTYLYRKCADESDNSQAQKDGK